MTWRTRRAFLEITVAAVVVPSHRSLHRDGLPDASTWSSVCGRRVGSCGRILSRFSALSENSTLYVKESSNICREMDGFILIKQILIRVVILPTEQDRKQ